MKKENQSEKRWTMTNKAKDFYERIKSIRGTWGNINPVTKIKKDKTKYTRKEKHKGKDTWE